MNPDHAITPKTPLLVHLVVLACQYLGISRLFYFLNRNRKRILAYHNVIQDVDWPV